MAISRQKAVELYSQGLRSKVENIEIEIDSMLILGEYNYTVKGIPAAVVQQLIQNYRLAGWIVKYVSERDGDYLHFDASTNGVS